MRQYVQNARAFESGVDDDRDAGNDGRGDGNGGGDAAQAHDMRGSLVSMCRAIVRGTRV